MVLYNRKFTYFWISLDTGIVCFIIYLYSNFNVCIILQLALIFFPFFRSPLNPVLGLTFDQVAAFARGGITVAYKTFLDPSAALLPGCDK